MTFYDDLYNQTRFIQAYKHMDFSRGGKLNLCDMRILKKLWKERYPESTGVPYISILQNYFRDKHIEYMYHLKANGENPESLLALGFRPETVNKYWDNRELAERIVGRELP